MSAPQSDRPPWRSGVLQRLLVLVEGKLAQLPPRDRKRMVAWQELRLRIALGHMFSLLILLAACKVILIVMGVWPTDLRIVAYVCALLVLGAMRFAYGRAGGLAGEGISATVFLLALIALLADPSLDWSQHPGLALGWVWLLGSLGIPLLVRLQSVAVFVLVLLGAVLGFFWLVPVAPQERLQLLLYLSISIAGGLLLRRMRSDASLDYRRTTDAVTASANTDALTTLANRRGWRQQAPRLLAECAEDDRPVSLLFIDLDHFKHLNDVQGHAAGDAALRKVGELLKGRIGGGLGARLGGEEFVCLLPGLDQDDASDFAGWLREALKAPPLPLTFSGGIAQWQPGESLHELLARGDAAMYQAKKSGRDNIIQG